MQAYQYAQARSGPIVGTGPMGPPGSGPIAVGNPPVGQGPMGPPGRGPILTANPPHGPEHHAPAVSVYHVAGTTLPMPTAFPSLAAALGFVQAHFPAHGTVTISTTT